MTIEERPTVAQQENLVTLLCYSDQHGRLIANSVDVQLFQGEYRTIAARAISYWREHGKAPGVHTADLVADELEKDQRTSNAYRRILLAMGQLNEDINAEYVITTLNKFTRVVTMRSEIWRAASLIDNATDDNVEEAERILHDVLRGKNLQFTRGTHLDDDLDDFLDFMQQASGEFSTGITALDRRGIVPARGRVMMMLGGKGRGKTWFLTGVGCAALLSRKKALHLSLEIDEPEMRMRYYQSLFAVSKRLTEQLHNSVLRRNRSGEITRRQVAIEPEFAFNSPDIKAELETRIMAMGQKLSNLEIKRFPSGKLTVDQLEAYLDYMEQAHNFIPDLLLLDYPRLMKLSGRPADRRIAIGDNMVNLRALAIERNIALVTVEQLNRSGYDRETAKSSHAGEDWVQIQTCDTIMTHSQTDAEKRAGLARLYVDHARTESDKINILLTQNLAIGQFCIESTKLPSNYFSDIKPRDQEDDDEPTYDEGSSEEN